MSELEMDEATAKVVMERIGIKAKEVAEQQQKDKEAKERKSREDADAARALLEGGALGAGEAGEAAASAILAAGSTPTPGKDDDARAADILGQA
jgi:hypothetical protein